MTENGEPGGVVVEHQTPNRGVVSSIPTVGSMLCPEQDTLTP